MLLLMMQPKSLKTKILIIGCGTEQLDAILTLKKKRYYLIGIDKNINAPGAIVCDKFYTIDVKDKQKILKIAKINKIDGVITVGSDITVPTVQYVSHKMLLSNQGIKFNLCLNKFLMKKNFIKNKIPTPEFIQYRNKENLNKFVYRVGYPIVIKPLEAWGQKGISLIKKKINFKKKLKLAKSFCQKKKVLIEKYEEGKEINIVTIIENFKIKLIVFSLRLKNNKKSFGVADQHSYPVKISALLKKNIKKNILKIAKSVNLKNGILYPQIIIYENKFTFLEVACRIPGGKMRDLVLLATGYDPIEFEIYNCLGFKKCFLQLKKKKKI